MFFVQLWVALGKIGSLTFSVSQSNRWVIHWSVWNWESIIGPVAEYFRFVYGEKYIAWAKLAAIHSLLSLTDPASLVQLVKLVYSMAEYGKSRLLTLPQKLASLSLEYDSHPLPIGDWSDNSNPIPHFCFILGFLLGDASLSVRIRIGESKTINLIPYLMLPNVDSVLNANLFAMMKAYFITVNATSTFTSQLVKGTQMGCVTVEGVANIFQVLGPLLTKYSNLGYWKSARINMILGLRTLMLSGTHLTQVGLVFCVQYIYSFPYNPKFPLEYWLEKISAQYEVRTAGLISGHLHIQPCSGRGPTAGQTVAWKVVMPTRLVPKIPVKQFGFRDEATKQLALKEAVTYRDSALRGHLVTVSQSLPAPSTSE
jgi:hypothetical protein